MVYLRKTALIIIAIILLFLTSCSCSPITKDEKDYLVNDGRFSVHYFDVGQADCSLVYLPDGKTVMFDCGANDTNKIDYVKDFLTNFGVDRIDALVLTHPDSDHVGGAESIINAFEIGVAYIPHLLNTSAYPDFNRAIVALQQKGVELNVSDLGDKISANDYSLSFLSPYPKDFSQSSYGDLNSLEPTDRQINDVSPIVYISYKGVRFLFTGDAGPSQEQIVQDNYKIGYYDLLYSGEIEKVDLDGIDFLKVAHHGSSDCSYQDFLDLLKPKNAVISVGLNNAYSHPSNFTLLRLASANPECSVYRTDVYGTISVFVDKDGKTEIKTQTLIDD